MPIVAELTYCYFIVSPTATGGKRPLVLYSGSLGQSTEAYAEVALRGVHLRKLVEEQVRFLPSAQTFNLNDYDT